MSEHIAIKAARAAERAGQLDRLIAQKRRSAMVQPTKIRQGMEIKLRETALQMRERLVDLECQCAVHLETHSAGFESQIEDLRRQIKNWDGLCSEARGNIKELQSRRHDDLEHVRQNYQREIAEAKRQVEAIEAALAVLSSKG